MIDFNELQFNISSSIECKDSVYTWIYQQESLVFDIVTENFILATSYNVKSSSINFFIRSSIIDDEIAKVSFGELIDEIKLRNPNFLFIEDNGRYYIKSLINNVIKDYVKIINNILLIQKEKKELTKIYNISEILEVNFEGCNSLAIVTENNAFALNYARDKKNHEVIYKLQKNNYFAIKHFKNLTIFRKSSDYSYFKKYLPKNFFFNSNVFYTIEEPKIKSEVNNLVIFFSYTNKSNDKLVDRYYSHSYPFIKNTIMPNTYFIRICDFGGAFGSNYLNTIGDDNIENNIQNFIDSISKELNIDKSNIVIMGASSGGTGALYHGIKGLYKTISIDPFLGDMSYYNGDDPLYLKKLTTKPIGSSLFFNKNNKLSKQTIIVTSKNSEFYIEIQKFKEKFNNIRILTCNNPEIKKHTDVAKHTSYLVSTLINNMILDTFISNDLEVF